MANQPESRARREIRAVRQACLEIAKLGGLLAWADRDPELALQKVLEALTQIFDFFAGIDLPDVARLEDISIYQNRLNWFYERICQEILQHRKTMGTDQAELFDEVVSSAKLSLQARSFHWMEEALAKIDSLPQESTLHVPSAADIDAAKADASTSHPELLTGATVNRKIAAKALGISERTLDRWVESGQIKPIKVGGRIKFDSAELRRILSPSKPSRE